MENLSIRQRKRYAKPPLSNLGSIDVSRRARGIAAQCDLRIAQHALVKDQAEAKRVFIPQCHQFDGHLHSASWHAA